MALVHSPARTRSQAAVSAAMERATLVPVAVEETLCTTERGEALGTISGTPIQTSPSIASAETTMLQTVLLEIRQLREERAEQVRREAELSARLRQHEDELLRLQGNQSNQLSQSVIRACGDSGLQHANGRDARVECGVKLKPDIFDGTVPLREYLRQFELIAHANGWDANNKAIILTANLRGRARAVLESLEEDFSYEHLRIKLELQFGEKGQFQNFYMQFTNRKQKIGEDTVSFGLDLERLARLAYPECSKEIRDKIACVQFIAGLVNGHVKSILQLEGVISLGTAIKRAETVRIIWESSFSKDTFVPKESENFYKKSVRSEGKTYGKVNDKSKGFVFPRKGNGREIENSGGRNQQECWNCGEKGHFRNECPRSIPQRENLI